jgi:dihydroorotate dehydrogenase (NAD+) catalytic subunit
LTIGNTVPAMGIDVETRRPLLANITGGLSGPAVHPVAVRGIWQVFNTFARDFHGKGKHLPMIGLGGVLHWRDAAEFILAGATAVGMGTALFADPRSPLRIVRGLEQWVMRQGAASVTELVGAVRVE